jgi:hypothetical protein
MFFHKLKVAAALLLTAVVFAVGVAGTWALATGPGTATDDKSAKESAAPPAGMESPDALQEARHRYQTRKSLRSLVYALHNYADMNAGLLPPPSLVDTNGASLLSWRVLILPYIGEEKLYEQFHRDESWDSEHNKKLLAKMPAVFAAPGARDRDQGKTYYQAIVGPGAAFEEGKQLLFPADFTDGVSNTIGIIEAETPVPWTKPEDVVYRATKALPIPHRDFHVAFLDGTARLFSKDADQVQLQKMITRAGGEAWVDTNVLAHTAAPKDVQANAEQLSRASEDLRKALAKAREDLEKTLNELNGLRAKAGDKDAIAADNAKLRKKLDDLFDQMEEVRVWIEQLKKGRHTPPKPTPKQEGVNKTG